MKHFKVAVAVLAFFATVFVLYAHDMGDMNGMDMKDSDTKAADMKGMTMGACKMMDKATCPFCVKGAVIKVINTKDGIQVLVTSADKGTVKEIQEKGAKFAATCGNNKSTEKTGSAATAAAEVKETTMDGNPEEIVQCPVMGTKIKKKNAVAVLEYKGMKYYICCKMCIGQFKSAPEKYAK
jgi:YHS domain-containing protein